MSNHLKNAAKACPQQKYVLGGHSQGGYVTVQTIGRLPKDVSNRIIAVTMFGSPRCPESMRRGDRCRSYCNKGDFVSSMRIYLSSGHHLLTKVAIGMRSVQCSSQIWEGHWVKNNWLNCI